MRIYFGGTFDPVHNGHVQLASELANLFEQEKIYLMPCYRAVHKDAVHASAEQRLAMLNLAIKDHPKLCVDTRELMSGEPSYTFNSLCKIREEANDESIAFVIGTDSLLTFPSWYRSESLAKLTHLIVIERPESSFDCGGHPKNKDNLDKDKTLATDKALAMDKVHALGFTDVNKPELLKKNSSGLLISLKLSLLDISSTEIRKRVRENKPINHLVCDAVATYIKECQLYQNQER